MPRTRASLLCLVSPARPPSFSICRNCLLSLRSASTSTDPRPSTSDPPLPTHPLPTTHSTPLPAQTQPIIPPHQILASVLLSRPPFLTRTLHPFETALHLYNRRLNERLALPFSRYFYYPKGTALLASFKQRIKQRKTPARDIGVYDAYGKEGWDDEVRVGSKDGDAEVVREQLLREAEVEEREKERGMVGGVENRSATAEKASEESGEVVTSESAAAVVEEASKEATEVSSDASAAPSAERETIQTNDENSSSTSSTSPSSASATSNTTSNPSADPSTTLNSQIGGPRLHISDLTHDTHSLDRAGDRTLYLVVKYRSPSPSSNTHQHHQKHPRKPHWSFPSTPLLHNESLHTATERLILQTGGPNLNTWIIGNWPIAHQSITFPSPVPKTSISHRLPSSTYFKEMLRKQAREKAKAQNETELTKGKEDEENPVMKGSDILKAASDATSQDATTQHPGQIIGQRQPGSTTDLISGEKTFFTKARIAAGQVDLEKAVQGPGSEGAGSEEGGEGQVEEGGGGGARQVVEDFQWLFKEELQAVLDPRDWAVVEKILAER